MSASAATTGSSSATIERIVTEGTRRLAAAGIETAAQEAAWLLESVLSLTPLQLRINGAQRPTAAQCAQIESLMARRCAREPLQYLLGTQEFCGRAFEVTPAVLIPRPETELLIAEVAARTASDFDGVLVDMGTGSGCLAVTLACRYQRATIVATDRSAEALAVARHNAARYGVAERIEWREGDLLRPLEVGDGQARASVIVANPPYIPDGEFARLQPEVAHFEPRLALAGGPDGLAIYRRLVPEAKTSLAPGGWLVVEVGIGQAAAVAEMIAAAGGYGPASITDDHAQIPRVVAAQRRG